MSSETYIAYHVFGEPEHVEKFQSLISSRREALGGDPLESQDGLTFDNHVGRTFSANSKQSLTGREFETAFQAASKADVVAFVGIVDQDAERAFGKVFDGASGEIAGYELEDAEFLDVYGEDCSDAAVIDSLWTSLSSVVDDSLRATRRNADDASDEGSTRPMRP